MGEPDYLRLSGPRTTHFTASYMKIHSLKCLKGKKNLTKEHQRTSSLYLGGFKTLVLCIFKLSLPLLWGKGINNFFSHYSSFSIGISPDYSPPVSAPATQQITLDHFLLNGYVEVNSAFIKGHIPSFSEGTLSTCTHG